MRYFFTLKYIYLKFIYLIHTCCFLGRWVLAGRGKDTKLDIENLVPGQEYKFRVMAVNSEGESEPLETIESIIAKNPYGSILYNT